MANINIDSVLKKADIYIESADGKKRVRETVNNIITGKQKLVSGGSNSVALDPEAAAEKFIEVLHKVILEHAMSTNFGSAYTNRSMAGQGFLGRTAISALENIDYTHPYEYGEDTSYISVYFGGNLIRKSLDPSRYPDGAYDIVGLLNGGYAAKHAVGGVWEGHGSETIASLVNRKGTHFIQEAVDDFMGNYASQYGVIRIEVSGNYTSGHGTAMEITTL